MNYLMVSNCSNHLYTLKQDIAIRTPDHYVLIPCFYYLNQMQIFFELNEYKMILINRHIFLKKNCDKKVAHK